MYVWTTALNGGNKSVWEVNHKVSILRWNGLLSTNGLAAFSRDLIQFRIYTFRAIWETQEHLRGLQL